MSGSLWLLAAVINAGAVWFSLAVAGDPMSTLTQVCVMANSAAALFCFIRAIFSLD